MERLGLELKETMLYWARCVDNNPRAATHYGKWVLIKGNNAQTVGLMHWEFIPTYTLQDILDKLPEEIGVERRRYWLCIDMADARIFYFTDDFQMPGASLWNTCFRDGKTLLDAAYEMLVWCIEKKYVKTEGGGNA